MPVDVKANRQVVDTTSSLSTGHRYPVEIISPCAQVGCAVLLSFGMVAAPVAKTELFPTRVRAAGTSFPYSVAAVVFGGGAPLLTLCFANSGHPLLLGAYVSAICLAGSLVYFSMPETKGIQPK